MRNRIFTNLILLVIIGLIAGLGLNCSNPDDDGGGQPGLPDPVDNPGDPTEPDIEAPFIDVVLQGTPATVALSQEKDSYYLILDSQMGGGAGMYIVSPQGAVRQSGAGGSAYTAVQAISASSYYVADVAMIPPVQVQFDDPGLNPVSPFDGISDLENYYNEEVAYDHPDPDQDFQWNNARINIYGNESTGAPTPFTVDPATEWVWWRVSGAHAITYDEHCVYAGWPPNMVSHPFCTSGFVISHTPQFNAMFHMEMMVAGGISQQALFGAAVHLYIASPIASGNYFTDVMPGGDIAGLQYGGSSWHHSFYTPDPMNLPIQRGCTIDNISDFEFNSKRQLVITTGQNSHSLVIAEPWPIEAAGQNSFSAGVNFLAIKYMGGLIDTFSTQPGEFYFPGRVTIDPRNDHIIVSDTGNHRLQIMDEYGEFIRQIGVGVPSNLPGGLASPQAAMVDHEGTIFVIDTDLETGLPRMQRFRETSPSPQYGAIRGTVYDRDNGLPIPGALVAIQDQYLGIDPVASDSSGGFLFQNVPIGLYQLAAAKNNYFNGNTFVRVTTGFETNTNIFLTPQNSSNDTGTLFGTVQSSTNGMPIAGILVEIRGVGANAVTDHQGSWEINGLNPGDYIIDYSDPNGGFRSGTRSGTVYTGQSSQVDMTMDPLP